MLSSGATRREGRGVMGAGCTEGVRGSGAEGGLMHGAQQVVCLC